MIVKKELTDSIASYIGRFNPSSKKSKKDGLGIKIKWPIRNPFSKLDQLAGTVDIVSDCCKKYNDAKEIRSIGHEKFPGTENSEKRHEFGSYALSKKYSGMDARILGGLNEIQGFLMHDLTDLKGRITGESPWAFQLEDLVANEKGIIKAEIEKIVKMIKGSDSE